MGEVWRVGRRVIKTVEDPPAGLYPAEARGLALLEARGVRVPAVQWVGEAGLVLEYVEPGEPDWVGLAKMVARLHRSRESWYGGEHPVFIGRFPLPQARGADWKRFWIDRRLAPLLEATSKTLGSLRTELEELLERMDFPTEGACVVHGDLWSGNVHHAVAGPTLIDPSAWVAERVVDLAMMELFGGFPDLFWSAYRGYYPIPAEVEAALPAHQLYYLLVHVHFFGRGYLHGIRRVVTDLKAM